MTGTRSQKIGNTGKNTGLSRETQGHGGWWALITIPEFLMFLNQPEMKGGQLI